MYVQNLRSSAGGLVGGGVTVASTGAGASEISRAPVPTPLALPERTNPPLNLFYREVKNGSAGGPARH